MQNRMNPIDFVSIFTNWHVDKQMIGMKTTSIYIYIVKLCLASQIWRLFSNIRGSRYAFWGLSPNAVRKRSFKHPQWIWFTSSSKHKNCEHFYTITWEIGIFALTESINEKSMSATAMPVDSRSETPKQKNWSWAFCFCSC